MADDPQETPPIYLIPEDESESRAELHQRWTQERAAALATLLDHFTKDAAVLVVETVLDLEAIHTRYVDQVTRQWRRTAQVAYERGQKDGIGSLAIMEDVATGKTDPENDPPLPPPDTLH